jgi:hypothetical protein
MLKKMRRSSGRVTLVLMGMAALAACSRQDGERRDVYASREDCLADWGNRPEDCTAASDERRRAGGFFYGPVYRYHATGGGSAWTGGTRGGRSIGSTSSHTSRGGFGASGRSSGG